MLSENVSDREKLILPFSHAPTKSLIRVRTIGKTSDPLRFATVPCDLRYVGLERLVDTYLSLIALTNPIVTT